MQLVSLVHNLSQVKPASDILTYKFEFTLNQRKKIFNLYHAMEEFYDAAKPWLNSE